MGGGDRHHPLRLGHEVAARQLEAAGAPVQLEHPLRVQAAGRIVRAGQPVVAAGGDAVGELAERTEPCRHVGRRQRRETTEVVQSETVQQVDEVGGHSGHLGEQLHRQPPEERPGGGRTGRHHDGFDRDRISIRRSLDMRYVGQEHAVTVDVPLEAFENRDVAAIKARSPQALELVERTARINSGTLNPEGVREVGQLFRAELDTTFVHWRQQVLLARALSLAARKLPMSTIAAELGYTSASAFSAMVKRSVGMSPSRLLG